MYDSRFDVRSRTCLDTSKNKNQDSDYVVDVGPPRHPPTESNDTMLGNDGPTTPPHQVYSCYVLELYRNRFKDPVTRATREINPSALART